MSEIEQEFDWMVRAINDGEQDYYVRLAKLIEHRLNAIQLKKMERLIEGRKVIELGSETDSINKPMFLGQAKELRIEVELY